jgi:hypothetical protein
LNSFWRKGWISSEDLKKDFSSPSFLFLLK